MIGRESDRGVGLGSRLVVGAVSALALLLLSGMWLVAQDQEDPFPHADHEGLFPLCAGCHEGVEAGNLLTAYPEVGSCDGCHDGVDLVQVAWTPPDPSPGNVVFDHTVHVGELTTAGDPRQSCESCHTTPGEDRMAVSGEVQLGTCWGCHAHEAEEHFIDADCASCHVDLASSGFDRERIEALPVPEDHDQGAFVSERHGEDATLTTARCATCHTSDRCTACHVDTDRAAIAAISPAPEGMDLPDPVAHYPEPDSHLDEGWFLEHGSQASRESCATCHTSNDCAACHVSPTPGTVAELPSRAEAVAPGVGLLARAPASHESQFFSAAHPALAASDADNCATCHVQTFCTACHDGPSDGGYHPPSFVSRHASDAFGRSAECTNCHNAQVFCRECHQQVGLAGFGREGPSYHEGQSLWLIRHGQAARQNLESCASCHAQNDCTQCHGVLGAFKVSPHSKDFDALRAWQQSPRTCLACHLGNPLGGSLP